MSKVQCGFNPDNAVFPHSLYDANQERDACGVGLVANIKGQVCKNIMPDARCILHRLAHRGAVGSEKNTGDGTGVMTSVPNRFLTKVLAPLNIQLPTAGSYVVGNLFLSRSEEKRNEQKKAFEEILHRAHLKLITWRVVPTCNEGIGKGALDSEPQIEQVFATKINEKDDQNIEWLAFKVRKFVQETLVKNKEFYICSLSSKTIVYKGQLTTTQLFEYFLDLVDPDYDTHFAVVHSRFSTNTFPSWARAHPFRYVAHNGEINTLKGNKNWTRAREGLLQGAKYGDEVKTLLPIIEENGSDSSSFDNALEFLLMNTERTLPEAMMTLVPEAWENESNPMPAERRAFYNYASFFQEPWDGPALFVFSDGTHIGAILDRNGLRPSRYYVTSDDRLIMASEAGVLEIPPHTIEIKGRLEPGRMLLVDTARGVIVNDAQLKKEICSTRPYEKWVRENQVTLEALVQLFEKNSSDKLTPQPVDKVLLRNDPLLLLHGYNNEQISMLLLPMVENGKEALGSMGNDAALAILSYFPRLLYDYFKQMFAQVTNPPIDSIREKVVMSLRTCIGPVGNFLVDSPELCHRLVLQNPILSEEEFLAICQVNQFIPKWQTFVIDITFDRSDGIEGYIQTIQRICQQASDFLTKNKGFIILSDRQTGSERVPISSLLAVGAIHQHLVRERLRLKCGLIVETSEAREVHHQCLLLGFGGDAICPYFVYNMMEKLKHEGQLKADVPVVQNYKHSMEFGILKVMAKMGISTLESYKGAQIFEAIGLGSAIIDLCFTGTPSRIEGIDFNAIANGILRRHELAYPNTRFREELIRNTLPEQGDYHWVQGGEEHINHPEAIAQLQDATRRKNQNAYDEYCRISEEKVRGCTIRGLMTFDEEKIVPIALEEVESAACIVKRFVTGAMSFGSLSQEAHEALAIAMNKIGGKSNTGEGGEDPIRYIPLSSGDSTRSAIKQVASGRFGVTMEYLVNSDEIQIKMAQGAKPGEGGELPGYKVIGKVAETRMSTPGVGLISPPPHHDIYSIEDLAQLIYDLKCTNPRARISVKLVSEIGVGVIASGVVKGHADHILISGHDGGTGASSWTGIKHAGLPWELGLAETHQTLVLNNLRGRVVVQTDGQLRTGRDVVIAALLGAEEFGFSTAPLIALGCTMMRKCHLNTCPVGIATQDPELRKKFAGKPEDVINFFFMVAEEVRTWMAKLGFRSMNEMIGRSEVLCLDPNVKKRFKTAGVNLSSLLRPAHTLRPNVPVTYTTPQQHGLDDRLEYKLLYPNGCSSSSPIMESIQNGTRFELDLTVENTDRCFGTSISSVVTSIWGGKGLEDDTIILRLKGTAGQSLGSFLSRGISVIVEGEANDYVAKGLSGGQVFVYPARYSPKFQAEKSVIVGNVCLYGATSGLAFFGGRAAERFSVRNSGAVAVVDGVGEHGCEYMSGGCVVVLGRTGKNFGAGMLGGIAYVLDEDGSFPSMCNNETIHLEKIDQDNEDGGNEGRWVKSLIAEHARITSSRVAKKVVEEWESKWKSLMVKVMPSEYKNVLVNAQKEKPYLSLFQVFLSQLTPVGFVKSITSDALHHGTKHQNGKANGHHDDGHKKENGHPKPAQPQDSHQKENGHHHHKENGHSKTNGHHHHENGHKKENGHHEVNGKPLNGKTSVEAPVKDIEDMVKDEVKKSKPPTTDKLRGFMKYKRKADTYREASQRIQDYNEITSRHNEDELAVQSARCMDCGVPFCQSHNFGCPLGNLIPRWNDLVHKKQWKEALNKLLLTNNFPEFTGRVCPAPCEGACTLGIIDSPVAIKSIECAIIDRGYEEGWIVPVIPQVRTGKKIAVIGSGPAGLAAADLLNKEGHLVTVYERSDRIGGLLVYGIPNMKLDKALVQRRVDLMAKEGVTFQTNANVGENVDEDQLLQDNDAVLLAIGATWPRDLVIPGRELKGIHFAMDFLEYNQKLMLSNGQHTSRDHPFNANGKDVIIIGSGDTSTDCLATAVRQGARSITTFALRPPAAASRTEDNPWPQFPHVFKVDYGHEEAMVLQSRDPRMFKTSTSRFVGENGHIVAVETLDICWKADPNTGRLSSSLVPGSEKQLKADLVLLAMGYSGPETKIFKKKLGEISHDPRGNFQADTTTFRTSQANVYAAGDCRKGQSLVVWAIDEGRQAARQIDLDLMASTSIPKSGGVW